MVINTKYNPGDYVKVITRNQEEIVSKIISVLTSSNGSITYIRYHIENITEFDSYANINVHSDVLEYDDGSGNDYIKCKVNIVELED